MVNSSHEPLSNLVDVYKVNKEIHSRTSIIKTFGIEIFDGILNCVQFLKTNPLRQRFAVFGYYLSFSILVFNEEKKCLNSS